MKKRWPLVDEEGRRRCGGGGCSTGGCVLCGLLALDGVKPLAEIGHLRAQLLDLHGQRRIFLKQILQGFLDTLHGLQHEFCLRRWCCRRRHCSHPKSDLPRSGVRIRSPEQPDTLRGECYGRIEGVRRSGGPNQALSTKSVTTLELEIVQEGNRSWERERRGSEVR